MSHEFENHGFETTQELQKTEALQDDLETFIEFKHDESTLFVFAPLYLLLPVILQWKFHNLNWFEPIILGTMRKYSNFSYEKKMALTGS